jgi:predicted secreted protein
MSDAIRRSLFRGAMGAAIAGVTVGAIAPASAAAPTGPDAYILSLGKELAAAIENEKAALDAVASLADDEVDAIFEPAFERTKAITARIVVARATTLEGLKVKARALQ